MAGVNRSSSCPRNLGVAYSRTRNSSNRVPLAWIRCRNASAPMACSSRTSRAWSASPNSCIAICRVPMERPTSMVFSTRARAMAGVNRSSSCSRNLGVAYSRTRNSSNRVPLAWIRCRNASAPMACSSRTSRAGSASANSRIAICRVPMERPAAMVFSTRARAMAGVNRSSSCPRNLGVAYSRTRNSSNRVPLAWISCRKA
ncbi:hypothetical protein CODIS_31680 [Candidatus Thiodiazotropha endolucinida]|uniref:Uncharacterized protein n=1 Tax=Candidatus Thiodiazotropha endolucinida TaxID=1655433 RepID=A0A7Z0VJI1_9GAMM|nr:hypothetical protein CODIS_31680 [Candidatus Thiodiazotropha endolucinida]